MLLNQIRSKDGDPEKLLHNSFYQLQADRCSLVSLMTECLMLLVAHGQNGYTKTVRSGFLLVKRKSEAMSSSIHVANRPLVQKTSASEAYNRNFQLAKLAL